MTSPGQAIERVNAVLRAAGINDTRQAWMILEVAAAESRTRFLTDPDAPLAQGVPERALALAERRAAGAPMSHIRGWRDFWKARFVVTPDVLDPRPETEVLVATALEEPFAEVLDLGSGSGCILLSLLAERPEARGTGTDVSGAALEVAGQNACSLGLEARCAFILADWFAGVRGRFDLIVSNPPYIALEEMDGLQRELAHEPRGALTDGGDGLSAYRAIAAGVGGHLAPGGRVLVEIGPTQGAAVSALFEEAGLRDIRVLGDLDGRDRVVAARAARG